MVWDGFGSKRELHGTLSVLPGTTDATSMATYSKGARSFDTERGGYLRLIVPSTSLFPYFLQSCPIV